MEDVHEVYSGVLMYCCNFTSVGLLCTFWVMTNVAGYFVTLTYHLISISYTD